MGSASDSLENGHFPYVAWESSHVAGGRKSALSNECTFGILEKLSRAKTQSILEGKEFGP